jgi:hypothetical protein
MNKDNKMIYEAYGDEERKAQIAMDNDIRTGDAEDRAAGRFEQDMDREIEADDQAEQPSGWEDQGLEELEPHELVDYISKALPQFLQTHYNPEDYDTIKASLYSAAELLQTPYGPDWYDHPGR